jgi:hypothetical protein
MRNNQLPWLAAFALAVASCTSDGEPTQKFVDGCREMPASCGGIYSDDGKTLAFLSRDKSGATQVYRLNLAAANAKPELVSLNPQGLASDGACHSLEFLPEGGLIFVCEATNLDDHASGATFYLKIGDAPLSLYSEHLD